MGNISSNRRHCNFNRKFFGNIKAKIGIAGLDAAGKTTILYQLKTGKNIETIPTAEFNVEEFQFANVVMRALDVSGGEAKR